MPRKATKTVTEEGVEQTPRIVIPPLQQKRLLVTLQGVTPLIVHRFGDKAQAQMQADQSGAAKMKKPPRVPDEDFRDSLYLLAGERNGDLTQCRFGFPATGLKRSIVAAGQRFADAVGTELKGSFSIRAEMLEIKSPQPPVMRTDMVRLSGPQRTASLAYRPQFYPWTIEVPIDFSANFISADQLVNLIRIAGFSVGIGDWRVERNGTAGQFTIDTESLVLIDNIN